MGVDGSSGTLFGNFYVSPGSRAGSLWYSISAQGPANGWPGHWIDTISDLSVCLVADGLSNHSPPLNVGILEYDQEHVVGADHRADGAHGTGARHARIQLSGL